MYFGKRNSYFKMYDPEANKYGGADYSQFDNTMAFSDSSIRAGKGYTCNFQLIELDVICCWFCRGY